MRSGIGRSFRLWAVVGVGTVAWLLTFITLAWPEWIEAVLGTNPDTGDGSLERSVTVASGVVFLMCLAMSLPALRQRSRLSTDGGER